MSHRGFSFLWNMENLFPLKNYFPVSLLWHIQPNMRYFSFYHTFPPLLANQMSPLSKTRNPICKGGASKFGWLLFLCYDRTRCISNFSFYLVCDNGKMVKMLKHGMPNSPELPTLGHSESYLPQIRTMHRIRWRWPEQGTFSLDRAELHGAARLRAFQTLLSLKWLRGIEGGLLFLTIFFVYLEIMKKVGFLQVFSA